MSDHANASTLALTGLVVGVIVPVFIFAVGTAMGRLFGWTLLNRRRRLVIIVPLVCFYLFQAWSAYVREGFGWRAIGMLALGISYTSFAWLRGLSVPTGAQQPGAPS